MRKVLSCYAISFNRGIVETGIFFRTATNQYYAWKIHICWSWSAISI